MNKDKKLEVRVTSEMLEAVKKLAEEEDLTCGIVVRKAIKHYLETKNKR